MTYNKMQEVKREVYAMRNGVVADVLRKAGSPFRFIMGVNIPQLKEIAARRNPDPDLAAELRADRACRESQLLWPLLIDPATVTVEEARDWLRSSASRESTDILCLSLLRCRDDALSLALECLADVVAEDNIRYAGLRLLWNIVGKCPEDVLDAANLEIAASRPSTKHLAEMLAEEARFQLGD